MTEEKKSGASDASDHSEASDVKEVPCDPRAFFESFYRASVKGEPSDRDTVGQIAEFASRFHYNATENSIIRAMMDVLPPPKTEVMTDAWRALNARRGFRQLDIGSGAGHWVDFFRDVFYVKEAVAVELTTQMADYLRTKYTGQAVLVLEADITKPLTPEAIGGPVDFISALGVMFHIVEDGPWADAIGHLAALLKPNGRMFIGGEFGAQTRNVQFHKSDTFETWGQHRKLAEPETRVNKRVRSLAQWVNVVSAAGLTVVDVIRTDDDGRFWTPENDLLVLRKV